MTREMSQRPATACTYCGGAGGNEENLEHNVQCPRFGYEAGVERLNALRDGVRNPAVAMAPCEACGEPMPARPGRALCAACLWIAEDQRIRDRLAAGGA